MPGLLAAPAEEANPSAGGGRKRSGDNLWGEVEGTVISYIFVRYSVGYTNVSVLPSHRSGNCVTQPVALRSARGHKPSFDQRLVRKCKRYGATVPAGVHPRSSLASLTGYAYRVEVAHVLSFQRISMRCCITRPDPLPSKRSSRIDQEEQSQNARSGSDALWSTGNSARPT